jgi:hypothetical protein
VAEAQAIAPVACVQNAYNLARRDDDPLVDSLAEQGVAYGPYFPLGGFSPLQSDALDSVAKRLDATPLAVALAWLLQALAEHPAHPRHVVGGPPAGERGRCRAGAPRGRGRRAGRDRRLTRRRAPEVSESGFRKV